MDAPKPLEVEAQEALSIRFFLWVKSTHKASPQSQDGDPYPRSGHRHGEVHFSRGYSYDSHHIIYIYVWKCVSVCTK